MRGRRVGLEHSQTGWAAVVVRGRRITTARQSSAGVAPGGLPLRSLVGAAPLGGPPVHVALTASDHVHRVLQLPPMTASERAAVVERENAREGEALRAAAWRLQRRVEVDGVAQDELLVVMAEGLDEALAPVLDSGVVPESVVTGPIALVAAAIALAPETTEHPAALLHWGSSRVTIVITAGGLLKFARVIEPPAAELDPFEWIPVEIERSIRHYALMSKGERVGQVLLSVAEAEGARRLFAGGDLSRRLHLPVINLNALLAPELPHDAPTDTASGAFLLAFGAALLAPRDAPNLLPAPLMRQRRSRRVLHAGVAATVLMAAVLGIQTMSLAERERAVQAALDRAQADAQADRQRIEQAARWDAERAQQQPLARLLTEDPLPTVPPADALREIARLAPPALRLDQLTVTLDDGGYVFSLTGRVEQDDFAQAQQDLNDFFYGLRESPLFRSVEIRQTSRLDPPPVPGDAERDDVTAAMATSVGGVARPLGFVVLARLQRLA